MDKTNLEVEAFEAGRRFRGPSKLRLARALRWFRSQQCTIGAPYMSVSEYALAERAFVDGAQS